MKWTLVDEVMGDRSYVKRGARYHSPLPQELEEMGDSRNEFGAGSQRESGAAVKDMMYRLTFLAIAIGLFFFPSVEYSVLPVDGPDTEFYGFPLPWNSRGLASSLTKEIYILPLVVDVVFFLAVGYWLWRQIERRLPHLRPMARRSILFSIWSYGAIAIAGIVVSAMVQEWFPFAWYDLQISDLLGIRLNISL
jgi:hypothetical protein